MAGRGQPLTLDYIAWDTVLNRGKTGDVANHVLRWVKDGVAAPPTNAPTEVSAVDVPGLYVVDLTRAETLANFGTLHGRSTTTGVVIIPSRCSFEQLPATVFRAGSVTGVPDRTSFVDTALLEADLNFWEGRQIIFVTGVLTGQGAEIGGFNPSDPDGPKLSYSSLTRAPQVGDEYIIV
jgi:hypothetical protein